MSQEAGPKITLPSRGPVRRSSFGGRVRGVFGDRTPSGVRPARTPLAP